MSFDPGSMGTLMDELKAHLTNVFVRAIQGTRYTYMHIESHL